MKIYSESVMKVGIILKGIYTVVLLFIAVFAPENFTPLTKIIAKNEVEILYPKL